MQHPLWKKAADLGNRIASNISKGAKELKEEMDNPHPDNYRYEESYELEDTEVLPSLRKLDIESGSEGEFYQEELGEEFVTRVIRRAPDYLAMRYNKNNPEGSYYYIVGANSPMHYWLIEETEYWNRVGTGDDEDDDYVPELFFPLTDSNLEGSGFGINGADTKFVPIGVEETPVDNNVSFFKLNPEYAESLVDEYNRLNFKIFAESFTKVTLRKYLINGLFCEKCECHVDDVLRGSIATGNTLSDKTKPVLYNPSEYIANTIILEDALKIGMCNKGYYEKRMAEFFPDRSFEDKEEQK
jgi:hypothetical protein